MVRQCFILFGCLALGELIVRVLDIKLPASIVGMLILTLLSTIIVLLITGQTHQVVSKGEDKVRKKIQTKKNKNSHL